MLLLAKGKASAMTMPWASISVNDFLAETQHLSDRELGAFVRLIFKMWTQPDCAIANDFTLISRIAGRPRGFSRTWEILRPIFQETDEGRRLTIPWLRSQWLFVKQQLENKLARKQGRKPVDVRQAALPLGESPPPRSEKGASVTAAAPSQKSKPRPTSTEAVHLNQPKSLNELGSEPTSYKLQDSNLELEKDSASTPEETANLEAPPSPEAKAAVERIVGDFLAAARENDAPGLTAKQEKFREDARRRAYSGRGTTRTKSIAAAVAIVPGLEEFRRRMNDPGIHTDSLHVAGPSRVSVQPMGASA